MHDKDSKLVTALHENVYSDLYYYLAHLYCKIWFSLRVFAFEGLNTKFSVNVFLA